MQIKTQNGDYDVASKGLGNTALCLGIAGLATSLLGGGATLLGMGRNGMTANPKQAITFMPKLYLKNHPTLVARPITELKSRLMSNAHYMQDVPLKRSARIFLDIIKQEAIPYINELEKTY